MNPNAKRLWVEALRSGKYKQTTGRLRRGGGTTAVEPSYCCLGVLCEVAKENGAFLEDRVLVYDTYPSEPVTTWAGLNDRDPELTDGELSLGASIWNDEKHASFAEIADMIERSL